LLKTRNARSIADQSWQKFKNDELVEHPFSGPGGIKLELRESVDRALRESIKMTLQSYYVEICDLFNRSVPPEDFDEYAKVCNEAFATQANYIKMELGPAARAKYLDRVGILGVSYQKTGNNERYNNILMVLDRTKKNIEELIKSEVWNDGKCLAAISKP
jgi:hypothetical protein